MRGIHINFPFKLGSVWVEWRERSVGFGQQCHPAGDREFFLGRLQGVWSPATATSVPHVPEVAHD